MRSFYGFLAILLILHSCSAVNWQPYATVNSGQEKNTYSFDLQEGDTIQYTIMSLTQIPNITVIIWMICDLFYKNVELIDRFLFDPKLGTATSSTYTVPVGKAGTYELFIGNRYIYAMKYTISIDINGETAVVNTEYST